MVEVELPEDQAQRLRVAGEIANQMARELGVELDRDAAERMAEVAAVDLAAAKTEMEKLASYVGETKRINAQRCGRAGGHGARLCRLGARRFARGE